MVTVEECLVVDDEVLPGYFGRGPSILFHQPPFRSLAATPLADALLLIDVILKAAQSLVSRVCVTIALYHINVAIFKSPFTMYITFYSRNARGAFRFEALELNAMKEKSKDI